jgi:hypothetical protein
MSVLDLFAAALGAFILIAVILFPDYQKQEKTVIELQATQQGLQAQQQSLNACKAALSSKDQSLATCETALASTFIVIAIEWSAAGNYDVDLHVFDPDQNEFFWGKSNRTRRDYPASEAQLSYDNTRGPGVELWQDPKATPGTYKIAYDYYTAPGQNLPVEVKGNVFYRNGRIELPALTLNEIHKLRPVASIIVGTRGDIQVRVEP